MAKRAFGTLFYGFPRTLGGKGKAGNFHGTVEEVKRAGTGRFEILFQGKDPGRKQTGESGKKPYGGCKGQAALPGAASEVYRDERGYAGKRR